MQLRGTRLCLDCEELHRDDRCPICASDAYTFLTQWIPVDERRARRREAALAPPPVPETGSARAKWLKRGVAGAALVTAGWLWKSARPMEWSERSDTRRTWPPEDDGTDG